MGQCLQGIEEVLYASLHIDMGWYLSLIDLCSLQIVGLLPRTVPFVLTQYTL
jgi:hypothetical protein